MPLYDFQCLDCKMEFEGITRIDDRKEVRCPKCSGKCKTLITSLRSRHWFREHINYEFTGEPIHVRSLQHYKDLCVKHGVTSRAIGDCRDYTHRGG